MNDVAAVEPEQALLTSAIAKEMDRQMRAIDTYGTYDNWPTEKVLAPLILTKEQRREIPVIGDPDEIVLSRVRAYYNAIAALIENDCGLMAVPMINITHEGFGRGLITVGKLVVLDKTLRDVHRFSFPSLEKMKADADKLVGSATKLIAAHRAVAEL